MPRSKAEGPLIRKQPPMLCNFVLPLPMTCVSQCVGKLATWRRCTLSECFFFFLFCLSCVCGCAVFSRSFLRGCVSTSSVRTRNSPRLSTNSSQHQKQRYGIWSGLGSMSEVDIKIFNSFFSPLCYYGLYLLVVVAAAGSASPTKDHPRVPAG